MTDNVVLTEEELVAAAEAKAAADKAICEAAAAKCQADLDAAIAESAAAATDNAS